MNLEEYQSLQPHLKYTFGTPNGEIHEITFLTPNTQCAWRVQTLDTKEPDTIAWLAKMQPGETLYDVGANMGQYALIAAKRGLKVHAFEPESQNFALLCRNVGINNLGDAVVPWPLALSDEASIDYFWVQNLQVGGSCSSYGEQKNFHLEPKQYAVRQGSTATTMAKFAAQFGSPDHVKIDVDGFEHKVIAGMDCYLLDKVKSMLVEINTALPEHLEIIDRLKFHGLEPDLETADTARRTEGAFAGIGNVIFYRK